MTQHARAGYLSSRVAFIRELAGGAPLWMLLCASVGIRLLADWRNVGFLNADEHYQILEFAQYKLGRQPLAALAWEFPAHIRAALQPWLAVGAIRAADALGLVSPFAVALALRVLSSALAAWASFELCVRTLPVVRETWLKRAALGATGFFWLAPVTQGRFGSENWGGALLMLSVCLTLDAAESWLPARRAALWRVVAAGLLASAAFYCRFQLGSVIAGLVGWLLLIRRVRPAFVVWLGSAFLIGCALNTVLDHWLYGAWVCSPYDYFVVNLIDGKAATFGVSPWWMLTAYMLVILIPPFSLALLGLLLAGSWYARRSVLVWMIVPFLLMHTAIAHKEPRFLTPVLFMLGPWFAVCVDALPRNLASRIGAWLRSSPGMATSGAWMAINLALMVLLASLPANDRAPIVDWAWHQAQSHPLHLLTVGASPYVAADDNPELTDSFYRATNLAITPFPLQPGSPIAFPAYVYYRGNAVPPEVRAVGACVPIVQSYPSWLTRYAWATDVGGFSQRTVCEIDRRGG